jgi:hypothetical protein
LHSAFNDSTPTWRRHHGTRFDLPVSIETWHAEVATSVSDTGAVLGNDMSGFTTPNYRPVAQRAGHLWYRDGGDLVTFALPCSVFVMGIKIRRESLFA